MRDQRLVSGLQTQDLPLGSESYAAPAVCFTVLSAGNRFALPLIPAACRVVWCSTRGKMSLKVNAAVPGLVLALVFRPTGLLGKPEIEKV